MAIMINCATDWSFDKFLADCKEYDALPIKGVRRPKASAEEAFIASVKLHIKEFIEANRERFSTPIGTLDKRPLNEALKRFLDRELYFSDWYKDTYNQRPHLDVDLYLWALGFEETVDSLPWVGLSFRTMDGIVEDYADHAKRTRERLEREW